MHSWERQMDARQARYSNSRYGAVATAIALPAQPTGFLTREMVIAARETAMVVVIQLAFRAMLLLRRWNY
jgi:hypothetical protein